MSVKMIQNMMIHLITIEYLDYFCRIRTKTSFSENFNRERFFCKNYFSRFIWFSFGSFLFVCFSFFMCIQFLSAWYIVLLCYDWNTDSGVLVVSYFFSMKFRRRYEWIIDCNRNLILYVLTLIGNLNVELEYRLKRNKWIE